MHILVMAKAPIAGAVKTRLCPPCLPAQAARIAAAALADTLDAAIATDLPVVVALAGPVPRDVARRPVDVVAQVGCSFGQRLEHAWAGMPGGAVQVGMDTPQVTAEMLVGVAGLLATAPAALGLAEDGGWWCLGMRRPVSGVFRGVPMSTADTGLHQYDRLVALGAEPVLVDRLRDVDTWADALDVARLAPRTQFAAAVASIDHETSSVGVGVPPGRQP